MINGHIKHIGDRIFIPEQHLQSFAVEALAVTYITRHIHIRQELHFDAQLTLSLTGFTTPAMHVERETPGLVAAHFAFGQFRIQLSDLIEQAGVCSRVRARCASDRRLVDVDDLVEMLNAFDFLVFACRSSVRPSILEPVRCKECRSSTWTCPNRKRP